MYNPKSKSKFFFLIEVCSSSIIGQCTLHHMLALRFGMFSVQGLNKKNLKYCAQSKSNFLPNSIYIFVLHICGVSSHTCALFNFVEECKFNIHFIQPSLSKQLIRSCENKGYFVVRQHALLLTELWRLEFHNAQFT